MDVDRINYIVAYIYVINLFLKADERLRKILNE